MATGSIMAILGKIWGFSHKGLAIKEGIDLFRSFFKSDKSTTTETSAKAAAPTPAPAPAGTSKEVDSLGKADNHGLAVLGSLYPATEVLKPGEELLSLEQRVAIGYLTSILSPNKQAAFKQILSLGARKHVVEMTYDEAVLGADGKPTGATKPVTQSLHLATESVIILRGIANDILRGNKKNEAAQRQAAVALVTRLEDLDVFDNLADDAASAWNWLEKKIPILFKDPVLAMDMARAVSYIGPSKAFGVFWTPRGIALRVAIASATDEVAREEASRALRDLVIFNTMTLYRARPPKPRISLSGWIALSILAVIVIGLIITPLINR